MNFYISKRAKEIELDPAKRTAVSLFKIIQFLFYRVPREKKLEFFNKLRRKMMKVSPGNISLKKMPPSSSIGQSLSITRNLLSGLNPQFVTKVLIELSTLLNNIGLKHLKKGDI